MDKAACYREQGRFKESADLYKKAMEGREAVLGFSHADTLWAMNNYGLVLSDLGEKDAALSMQRRALGGQEKILGTKHKHYLWTKRFLEDIEDPPST